MQPKTPSRMRARSEVKTPITPALYNAMNQMSMASPTKKRSKSKTRTERFDMSNPFISATAASHSRPASPTKKPSHADLGRQAASGVIKKGDIESSRRMMDVVASKEPAQKPELKRSKSTPSRAGFDQSDRFITTRDMEKDVVAGFEKMHIQPQTASPGHTARLADATGVPLNRRILSFHEPPPAASSDKGLALQRDHAKPLYASRPNSIATSTGAVSSKSRKISSQPERVLSAVNLMDDFYLNLVSWSSQNTVAVALGQSTYIWYAETGDVSALADAPEGLYPSSVEMSNDGAYVGIGLCNGDVQLYDVESGQRMRNMTGHQGQVACLSWSEHILTSGCADGSIWHHDVRIGKHKVMELLGHTGEVCGLKWRSDGELLASGGNDNVVNVWDGRLGDVGENAQGKAKWVKRNHTAAVKALAWCPWQPSLLATGGGTNDATMHIWNVNTGARVHSQKTPAQISTLQWSPHKKEILSTHGYPTNAIMVHAYPSMERVAEIRDAHDSRVLFSCVSPAGDVVLTGGGDESLKFWKIWEAPSAAGKKKKSALEFDDRTLNTTRSGVMSIR
ncbi:WD repeat-containing protein slp1 [Cylindrobasidium torrendii FP15055 ss-10]|uniref:WD repeat-containing protein slp1 n=1 Tax=Cylindrobasidium torrendii FP15055 ss-10 TaxID=1314674 RepID=A0A0D7AW38_9AGAR|nr:WD repeat-containing protein slp1 [Cylindrobasidium torrendii FP15055 ss-10]